MACHVSIIRNGPPGWQGGRGSTATPLLLAGKRDHPRPKRGAALVFMRRWPRSSRTSRDCLKFGSCFRGLAASSLRFAPNLWDTAEAVVFMGRRWLHVANFANLFLAKATRKLSCRRGTDGENPPGSPTKDDEGRATMTKPVAERGYRLRCGKKNPIGAMRIPALCYAAPALARMNGCAACSAAVRRRCICW